MVLGRKLSTRALLVALLSLGASGCAQAPPERFITGIEVLAPQGWTEFCRRNPTDVDCRG